MYCENAKRLAKRKLPPMRDDSPATASFVISSRLSIALIGHAVCLPSPATTATTCIRITRSPPLLCTLPRSLLSHWWRILPRNFTNWTLFLPSLGSEQVSHTMPMQSCITGQVRTSLSHRHHLTTSLTKLKPHVLAFLFFLVRTFCLRLVIICVD